MDLCEERPPIYILKTIENSISVTIRFHKISRVEFPSEIVLDIYLTLSKVLSKIKLAILTIHMLHNAKITAFIREADSEHPDMIVLP